MYANNRTRRKWNQVLLFLVSCHFVKYSISSPIFSSQFSQFQAARNIRNLPCAVRKSGLRGVCMFAIDCIKSNGTHLGTCIDKFYFGSCCQMKDVDSIYNPEISDNRIDTSFPASSYNTNSISEKPFIPVSSSTSLSSSVSHYASNYKTTSKPANNYNNKTFELIPSSKSPTVSTTERYTAQVGGFTTTLGAIIHKNVSTTISFKDELPTESNNLATFQSIQDSKHTTAPTAAPSPARTTPTKSGTKQPSSSTAKRTKKPATKPTTNTPVSSQLFNRTSVSSSDSSSSLKPSRRPSTTVKPSKIETSTVIKTTRKPVASTNVTVNRRTTISSRRNVTSTTRKPISYTSSTPAILTTISYVETTKAQRPKPTPTDFIVKVEPTTLSAEDILVTTFSVDSTDKTSSSTTTKPKVSTSKPTMRSSTVKTTLVTRDSTKWPNIPAVTTSNEKPKTEPTSTLSTLNTKDETTSKPINLTTAAQKIEISTTSATGLVTWTLGHDVDNTTRGQSWVLVPSVTPSEFKATTAGTLEIETTPIFSSNPPVTNKIIANEETMGIENIQETTLDSTSDGPEDSTDYIGITESFSESEEEVEEFSTTEAERTGAVDSNFTSSSLTSTEFSSSTPSLSNASTSTEFPLEESVPAVNPYDTTIWPVTQRNNDTSEENTIATEANSLAFNESSTMSYESSSVPSLEGVDFKTICGKRMFPEPRIVGGAKASFGRWPWQISLRQWRTSTYLHKCGSALLNENWAISAAHCVDNVPPSDLLLRLGEYDLSIEEEPYGYQERRVQIVASHPQFDPRTFEYDLALLRFYEPVIFQPNIIPVCVPEIDEDFIGRTAYVTGWGRLYEDGPLPSVLQEVTVPVIKNDICESMYRNAGYIEHIPHIFICAGHKQGSKDSCEGDSGGPMVIQRTDKRFQLAGIISWGIGCAEPNQPGVYTRISEFRDWINQILMF